MLESANMYARKLVTYIASPLKVENLTKIEYGHAPPLRMIAEWRYEIEQQEKRFKQLAERHDGPPKQYGNAAKQRYYASGKAYTPVAVEAKPFVPPSMPVRTWTEVVKAVADAFDLTYDDLRGKERGTKYVCARAVAARILVDRKNSTTRTGKYLGGRDHSTIVNLLKHWDDRVKKHPQMLVVYEGLTAATKEANTDA